MGYAGMKYVEKHGCLCIKCSTERTGKLRLGKPNTEESNNKNRHSQYKRIKRDGLRGFRGVNPESVVFLILFNVVTGLLLQHGYQRSNGGSAEKQILFYSVDGHQELEDGTILIVEYDEAGHLYPKARAKDIKRQKEIEEHFEQQGKNCFFLRFNEKAGDWHELNC